MTDGAVPVLRLMLCPEPAHNVVSEVQESGAAAWRTQGEDPQFKFNLDVPLPAGWYRFQCLLAAIEVEQFSPCLYVDAGEGFSEAGRLDLRFRHGDEKVDCIVHLKQGAATMRFDPLEGTGAFRLDHVRMMRLSVEEAAWLMCRALIFEYRVREPHRAAATALGFRNRATSVGLSCATEELWNEYRENSGTQDALYRQWLLRESATSPTSIVAAGDQALPLISIIVLGGAISSDGLQSVIDQHYCGWELIQLAGGQLSVTSRSGEITSTAHASVAGMDQLASAVAAASGTFVFPVDHASRLSVDALGWFADAIEQFPDAAMLYGDEDFIGQDGQRYMPWFKGAWDRDLAMAQDFLSGVTVLRTELARANLDSPVEADAAAYDMALRVAARVADSEIVHVPRVIRHNASAAVTGWDGLPGRDGGATRLGALRAVDRFIARKGLNASAAAGDHGVLVTYSAAAIDPSIEIIIPTRDRLDLLARCVDSVLQKTTCSRFRITIVNNGSVERGTLQYLASITTDPRVRVMDYNHPFNYSALNNAAVHESDADLIVLLNNDIEVISSEWLTTMSALAMLPDVGAVGAKLYYPDDSIQHAGVILGVRGVAAHPYARTHRDHAGYFNRALLTHSLSAVTAACLAIRRSIFVEVGGLDEQLAVAFNDVDFCLRVRAAGYRNLWTPEAELYHHESATRGYEDDSEKKARFMREVQRMRARWGPVLDDDPAYSPNLGLRGEAFAIDPLRSTAGRSRDGGWRRVLAE